MERTALDARTAIVAGFCLSMVLFALLAAYGLRRRTYPGFVRWTAASGLVALGLCLMALRGVLPDALSVLGANAAFATASVLRLSGSRQYLGLPAMPRAWWALPAAATALAAWFSIVHDSLGTRVAVSAAAMSLPALATAAAFLRAPEPGDRDLHRATGGLLLLVVVALAARAASAPSQGPVLFATGTVQTLLLLAAALLEAAWNVTFLMLNASRLERELRGALEDVSTLSGLLPICAWCKKVRHDDGYWQQIEHYLSERAGTQVTHGICPECSDTLRSRRRPAAGTSA
jgi:hypothetical protein